MDPPGNHPLYDNLILPTFFFYLSSKSPSEKKFQNNSCTGDPNSSWYKLIKEINVFKNKGKIFQGIYRSVNDMVKRADRK